MKTDQRKLNIVFFGSSIVSAYWNGAATYYRGIVKALHKHGHHVTFIEPDIYDRQKHRDIADPEYCQVIVYNSEEHEIMNLLEKASDADIIIKASGVGKNDELLEREIVQLKTQNNLIVFWDVDAPATLDRINSNPEDPFNALIPCYDFILTYGGGQPVIDAYTAKQAKQCIPIYNALDTDSHFPVGPQEAFNADLAFLGNRLPDRESRVEEFFLQPASHMKDKNFILGGSGWENKPRSSNINYIGHVYTKDHNAFNCTPTAVLNISRDSMARFGFSPATRVFEAAGAKACIITDAWDGIEFFFEPHKEILVAQNGAEVSEILKKLTRDQARQIGEAAYNKVLEFHTYDSRAKILQEVFDSKLSVQEDITA